MDIPRISVNKLGEYIVATPSRQRAILYQLKHPDENRFSSTSYKDAREVIKSYLLNDFEPRYIMDRIDLLKAQTPDNDYQKVMIKSEKEALRLVLKSEAIDRDMKYYAYTGDNPKMNIENVDVSIYPDLLIKKESKKKSYFGAMKIHLSKNAELEGKGAQYISALLYQFVSDYISVPDGFTIKDKCCISFDVFRDCTIPCPPSTVKRLEDIKAACKNISAIWSTI